MFDMKRVLTKKYGGCDNCKNQLKYNEDEGEFEWIEDEVNQFCIGNSIIRLCDRCLKELKESLNNYCK